MLRSGVNSSINFEMCVSPCRQPSDQGKEHFYARRGPRAPSQLTAPAKWKPSSDFCCQRLVLPVLELHVNEIIYEVVVCVWLLSIHVVSVRFLLRLLIAVEQQFVLFIAGNYPIIQTCPDLFIHSTVWAVSSLGYYE